MSQRESRSNPALWVGNYPPSQLHTWFYDAGGRAGTPLRGEWDAAVAAPELQNTHGLVGAYAPDEQTASIWRENNLSTMSALSMLRR